MHAETCYANTDFDLISHQHFDTVCRELDVVCCVIHYGRNGDGQWIAAVESSYAGRSSDRDAASDIAAILQALRSLSSTAKAELEACHLREFNIGIHCGDTWAYAHSVPELIIREVADAGCSIGMTLYPMRHPDGTLRE